MISQTAFPTRSFSLVAHSGWMHPLFGYWAAIASLGTAYVGTLGQAVGVLREFSGPMSKPWRMVALHLGAWITYGLFRWHRGDTMRLMAWTCLFILAGCVATIGRRLARILRALKTKNESS